MGPENLEAGEVGSPISCVKSQVMQEDHVRDVKKRT